jgi:hypothetical protein
MNNPLKLWTAVMKDARGLYDETHGILSEQKYGFRLLRSIRDALASIIMMIRDAKIYIKDIYLLLCADFKGALNAADSPASCLTTCTNSVCSLPLWTSAKNYTVSPPQTTTSPKVVLHLSTLTGALNKVTRSPRS